MPNLGKKKVRLSIVLNPAFGLHTCYSGFYGFLQSKGYEIVGVAGEGESDHERVRALGVKTHVVPIERYPNPISDFLSLMKLWRFFLREQFDVVQVSTPKASLLAILAARLAGQRHIMYLVRGRAYECKRGVVRWIYGRLDAWCCHMADMVVAVSCSLRDEMIREGICSPEKIRIVGSGSSQGIDLESFVPDDLMLVAATAIRESLGLADGSLLVLFVGWVRREKGILELVDAIRVLRSEGLDVHLVVLGETHEPKDIDSDVLRALECDAGFHRHGWVAETKPYYFAADVLVLPSWREGFPRVALEAAAAGRPVITTDAIGCRDSVVDGVTGLIVPVRDATALTEAMRVLLLDSARREEMGARARDRVRCEFDQLKIWDGTEALLRELADRGNN